MKQEVNNTATDLKFVQLWDDGPEFAVLPCDDFYQLGAESYLTWAEAQLTAAQNTQGWRLPIISTSIRREHHLFVDRKSFRYPIMLVVKK